MATSSSASDSTSASQWWRGLTLVLLATLFFALQNVFVRIATSAQPMRILGGLLSLGGYVMKDPNNPFQVPLLVLLVRITLLLPILWIILPLLKPGAWTEAKHVVTGSDGMLKLKVAAAGVFLFLSQTANYLAINKVGPATANAIFFIYPTITTLLAWRLFGDRPSGKQWLAIALIYSGCVWLAFSIPNATFKNDFTGIFAAAFAGIVFACEGILAQSCFGKVSPITFTGLLFTVEWLVLFVVALSTIHLDINGGLVLMGALLSLATLSAYLLNNSGIKDIGAAATSIIGSSGPAVTAIFGLLFLGEATQWWAIALVTVGVVLMNLAKAQAKVARF